MQPGRPAPVLIDLDEDVAGTALPTAGTESDYGKLWHNDFLQEAIRYTWRPGSVLHCCTRLELLARTFQASSISFTVPLLGALARALLRRADRRVVALDPGQGALRVGADLLTKERSRGERSARRTTGLRARKPIEVKVCTNWWHTTENKNVP